MKQELKYHLIPLLTFYLIASIFWIINKTPWYNFVYLFCGLSIGSFLLDIDHLIFWLYRQPKLEESQIAKELINKKKYKQLLIHLEKHHLKHHDLIFHHYFFQVILTLVSVFVFTSSINIFAKSVILALNIHLLVDELKDYQTNPQILTEWLFAREPKQLTEKYLSYFLGTFIIFNIIFSLFLLNS